MEDDKRTMLTSLHSNPFAEKAAVEKAAREIEARVEAARLRILGISGDAVPEGIEVHDDYVGEQWW